jgi:hypothetical protein
MKRDAIISKWLEEQAREARKNSADAARVREYGSAAHYKSMAEAYADAARAVRPHPKEKR